MKQAGGGRCTNVRGKAACFFVQERGIGTDMIYKVWAYRTYKNDTVKLSDSIDKKGKFV